MCGVGKRARELAGRGLVLARRIVYLLFTFMQPAHAYQAEIQDRMRDPLLLYSTNTWLAYAIAERYDEGVHFAWCSPVYDGTKAASHMNIPPTSSPAELYRAMQEVRRGERHTELIKRNRAGTMSGAKAKLEAGLITEARRDEIKLIVDDCHPREFRPVLFVMPFEIVRSRVVEVSVRDRAHPMSVEYCVEQLPRDCFDLLELEA